MGLRFRGFLLHAQQFHHQIYTWSDYYMRKDGQRKNEKAKNVYGGYHVVDSERERQGEITLNTIQRQITIYSKHALREYNVPYGTMDGVGERTEHVRISAKRFRYCFRHAQESHSMYNVKRWNAHERSGHMNGCKSC